jgi:hypothetical protein
MVLGSGIRKKPIPDPGVKKHPIPDPGYGSATLPVPIRTKNTCFDTHVEEKCSFALQKIKFNVSR